jgi:hypothetical protein
MSLVYIVGNTPSGARAWFVGTDTRILGPYKTLVQWPLFDNEASKLVSLEFANDAIPRWKDLGFQCFIAAEKYGPPIGGSDSAPALTERPVDHRSQFVPLSGGGVDGRGYFIHFSPERKKWYCRCVDIESMRAEHRDRETLWADKPEDVANKILELWGIKIAIPIDDPDAIARKEQERQQERAAQQRNNRTPGMRPGDR